MSTSRRKEEVHDNGRYCHHQHNDERRRSSNPPHGRQTPPNVGYMSLWRHGSNLVQCSADSFSGRTQSDHFPSQPIGLKRQKCTLLPSKVQPPMASYLSQIPHGPRPNQPTRNSTATPTQHPPLRSPSSNSLASPAPKRSLATSDDPFVLSKPHKHLRDQPEPLQV